MASVAPGIGLDNPPQISHRLKGFPKCLCKMKWPCPLKVEIPGLETSDIYVESRQLLTEFIVTYVQVD